MIALFQIPRPIDGDKTVLSSLENSMLAGCQLHLGLLFLEIPTSTSVGSLTKQANHLVVDKTLIGNVEGVARRQKGTQLLTFLSG